MAVKDKLAFPASRPYGNAPDSLMGFRKNGPNRGFDESNYKHTQKVRVHFNDDAGPHDDEIKGMNKSHALERARRNWPAATKIEDRD